MTTAIAETRESRKEAFMKCFNRLAVALRANDVDSVMMDIYFDALGHLPMWAVENAAGQLQRSSRFFPTTGEWCISADHAIETRLRESLGDTREWRVYCDNCGDTGFVNHICSSAKRCGRPFCEKMGAEHTHGFVSPCACRDHNPAYQRDLQHTRLTAQQRANGAKQDRR